jgi:hypothetical protein
MSEAALCDLAYGWIVNATLAGLLIIGIGMLLWNVLLLHRTARNQEELVHLQLETWALLTRLARDRDASD